MPGYELSVHLSTWQVCCPATVRPAACKKGVTCCDRGQDCVARRHVVEAQVPGFVGIAAGDGTYASVEQVRAPALHVAFADVAV
jgi:hypothetical protein